MDIETNLVNDVVILRPFGSLVSGEELTDLFNSFLRRKSKKFIINLDGVTEINSVGLSVLLEMRHKIEENGGDLRLCNLKTPVSRMFEITRLIEIFSIVDNEDMALAGMLSGFPLINLTEQISRYQH